MKVMSLTPRATARSKSKNSTSALTGRHCAKRSENFDVGYVGLYRKPLREAQKFLVISDVTLLPLKEENGSEVDVETPQCSQHLRSLSWPYLKKDLAKSPTCFATCQNRGRGFFLGIPPDVFQWLFPNRSFCKGRQGRRRITDVT